MPWAISKTFCLLISTATPLSTTQSSNLDRELAVTLTAHPKKDELHFQEESHTALNKLCYTL